MKCQIQFSKKNKKNISKCHLLKFYQPCEVLNNLPEQSNFNKHHRRNFHEEVRKTFMWDDSQT